MACFGPLQSVSGKNVEGVIVRQSMMVGRNPKFSFLRENEYEIGPCMTTEEYRGLGIYPYVLGICVRAIICLCPRIILARFGV